MKQVLIALDQLGNALLGGHADETVSARAWRLRARAPWGAVRWMIDWIFFWEAGHCEAAWRSELLRRHLPKGYRG